MAWEPRLSFTGERVEYEPILHAYRAVDGTPLVSASQFAAGEPFNAPLVAGRLATKHGANPGHILDMWERNGEVSRSFGTALHLAMEQWFRHRDSLPSKSYHLPKPDVLRDAVRTFPLRDENVIPEVLVSAVALGMAGRLDGLRLLGGYKQADIIDYKSDFDPSKNEEAHEKQLNFYRHVLEYHGWKIRDLVIWSYTGVWVPHYLRRVNVI